ncbi:carbohydrate porin [Flexithrix dorotheae]|uniref:carbohydrate porin n=1 Tax=Flexithrix dorotheae TaxID=70993 RepID=UPI00037CCD65|nr:carbohydrate porin [Flexithrix dorotheae]
MRNFLLLIFLVFLADFATAQTGILYQYPHVSENYKLGVGSYGRIGTNWNFVEGGAVGRRLNLNNMGSIGGRMEEQDYLELGTIFQMSPFKNADSTVINVQLRASVFSRSLSLFANSNTSSAGGLTIALPEMFVEAQNILTPGLNLWVGARLYRGPDLHMADHWYFNDHSGQGFGIEYKNTRLHYNAVSTTDTSSNVPPYFYINIKTGTPSLELRERSVFSIEHDIWSGNEQMITLLGEYHLMGNPEGATPDTTDLVVSYPADYGWVLGIRHQSNQISNWNWLQEGSFNSFSVRYGARLANGGDGGSSRTWETFGAPNFTTNDFSKAYSIKIVEHFLFNMSQKFSLNGYFIYAQSRGAADTEGISDTYFGREVFNRKEDFTIGFKGVNYISDLFHWQTELHYSQRKDGNQPWYNMTKISIIPTLAIRGERSVWSRPHLRFVFSAARYNDFARDNLYSPYLQLAGPESWGFYTGIKAEWWTW